MLSRLRRYGRAAEDCLRYNPLVRSVLSRLNLWRGKLSSARTPPQAVHGLIKLCAAARIAPTGRQVEAAQRTLFARLDQIDLQQVDWSAFVPEIDDPRIPKAAILKRHLAPAEKGVVFISFENQWAKLLRHPKKAEFAGRYHLVIAPSSSPHNLVNYVFPRLYPGPIFSLISNPEDQAALPRISDKFVVVPLYASQWVNPSLFTPLPRSERTIDLLMVANWAKFKRHFVLFSALRAMPPSLRIVLIGQDGEGRTAQTILEEARSYGVADRFELRTNQNYSEVVRTFGAARASVILSRREGSCVVVTESMFADTPVAILRNAELGSRVFVNEHTGRFLDERNLGRQLTEFIAGSDRYRPRVWAEEHLSCFHSSRTLNELLKQHELRQGRPWTRDLAPMQWAPDPRLVHEEDRHTMASERRLIQEQFGLDIGQ